MESGHFFNIYIPEVTSPYLIVPIKIKTVMALLHDLFRVTEIVINSQV